MSTAASTYLSSHASRTESGMRIVARRTSAPMLSDKQIIRLASVTLLIILLCLGYALLAWMGFWLTAENRWAINTAFLWVSGTVVLIGLSWPVALALRWAFMSESDRLSQVPCEPSKPGRCGFQRLGRS